MTLPSSSTASSAGCSTSSPPSSDRAEPVIGPRLTLTAVRYATRADLAHLAEIERDADALFAPLWETAGFDQAPWPEPMTGEARAELPGFLLVVGSPAVGFAHILDLDAVGSSGWHLEQVAVRPEVARGGIGTMLLRAAMGAVLDRGQDWLTLMTYAEVPWNGPWYAREGFAEIEPTDAAGHWDRLAPLREVERREGLERLGRRVGMVAAVADEPAARHAVSVIPLRESRGGIEVFVQHRALTMDFTPGVVVFPGGRVDPEDATTAYRDGIEVTQACAVREVREETGAVIDPAQLIPWDRWITPIHYPKRFDVEFFVLPVEGGEDFEHLTGEATRSEWMSVAELVRQVESGAASMVPPTRTIIDELSALGSLEAVCALRPDVVPIRHDITVLRPRPTGGSGSAS